MGHLMSSTPGAVRWRAGTAALAQVALERTRAICMDEACASPRRGRSAESAGGAASRCRARDCGDRADGGSDRPGLRLAPKLLLKVS